MSFDQQLLSRTAIAAAALGEPRIVDVHLVRPQMAADRDAEFGLVVLDDGSAGLYYAWLGGEQAELADRISRDQLLGRPASEIAQWLDSSSPLLRSCAVASINALTTTLYRRCGFQPPDAEDSFGGLSLQRGDHLGMIGYFAPLARRALSAGVKVTVLERKQHFVQSDSALTVTLDPAALTQCSKIICTGATTLNGSLSDMLDLCQTADEVALIGPTVGFFPDDVFQRGVASVAGSEIHDGQAAIAALTRGNTLTGLSRRTIIRRRDYPGFEALARQVTT